MKAFFTERPRLTAFLGLVLAMFFWSGNTLLTRANVGIIPPHALAFYRWLIATIVLLLLNYRGIAAHHSLIRAEFKKIMMLSLIGICLYTSLIYLALQATTAISVNMIGSSTPLITTLLAWLFIREKTNLVQIVSILLACAGVCTVISKGSLDNLLSIEFNHGDLLTIAAVLTWSSYSVLVQKWSLCLPPFVLLTLLTSLGLIGLLPLYCYESFTHGWFFPSVATLPSILYLAIFPSVISYSLWLHAIGKLGSSLTSFCGYMQIFFTTTLACLFLGETLHTYQVIGGLLTLTGLYLFTINKSALHIQENH